MAPPWPAGRDTGCSQPPPPCVPRAGDGTPGSLQLQVWSVDQQLCVTGELARKDKCQPPPAPRSSAQRLDNVWTVWHLKMSSRGKDVILLLQRRGFGRTRPQAGYGDAEGGKATVRVLMNRTRPLPREGSWVNWLIPVTSTSLRPRCLPLLPEIVSASSPSPDRRSRCGRSSAVTWEFIRKENSRTQQQTHEAESPGVGSRNLGFNTLSGRFLGTLVSPHAAAARGPCGDPRHLLVPCSAV